MPTQTKYDVKLVPINKDDLSDINRDYFSLFYNDPRNNPWMFRSSQTAEQFRATLQDKILATSTEVFVYYENNEPVGTCRIIQGNGPYQHVMTCGAVTIKPGMQNKGCGSRLLAAVKEHVLQHYPTVNHLKLSYTRDNPISQRKNDGNFYEKRGYQTSFEFHDWFNRSQPTQEWLNQNGNDHRADKFFWYPGEIFAAQFLKEPENYHKSSIEPEKTLRLYSSTENIAHQDNYSFTLAEIINLDQLTLLYQKSLTEWNDAYTTQEALTALLTQAISNQTIVILYNQNKELVAACQIDLSPEGLEHTAILKNPVVDTKYLEAATILITESIKHIRQNAAIKRLETSIVATNDEIIRALEINGFEYCGKQRAEFYDAKNKCYLDEYAFECRLFGLQDAIDCCTKRLQAQANLTEAKIAIPFNIELSEEILKVLKIKLNELQKNILSFEQEYIIFRLVRTVCTQDYLSLQERDHIIQELGKTFLDTLQANTSIMQLYSYCHGLINQPFNKLSLTTPFWLSQPNPDKPSVTQPAVYQTATYTH